MDKEINKSNKNEINELESVELVELKKGVLKLELLTLFTDVIVENRRLNKINEYYLKLLGKEDKFYNNFDADIVDIFSDILEDL